MEAIAHEWIVKNMLLLVWTADSDSRQSEYLWNAVLLNERIGPIPVPINRAIRPVKEQQRRYLRETKPVGSVIPKRFLVRVDTTNSRHNLVSLFGYCLLSFAVP